MMQNHNNTVSRKRKHLSYSERCQIAILKKEGYSNRQVAKVLRRVPQTINNEITRGTITQLKRQTQNGKVYDTYYSVYNADAGQACYEKQRLNCGRRPKWANTDAFIDWADGKMLNENGHRMSWLGLPENTSCSILPSFLEQPLSINGLTEESCEQRTWACSKNCPVNSKRSA